MEANEKSRKFSHRNFFQHCVTVIEEDDPCIEASG
jgi:hypothetical protein